jgi:hypothetical protein
LLLSNHKASKELGVVLGETIKSPTEKSFGGLPTTQRKSGHYAFLLHSLPTGNGTGMKHINMY